MRPDTPCVAGVLSASDVARTAAAIAAMQEPDGAIPFTTGQHTDVWNHVESAMSLLVAGEVDAAERALRWCVTTQRADGSRGRTISARPNRPVAFPSLIDSQVF